MVRTEDIHIAVSLNNSDEGKLKISELSVNMLGYAIHHYRLPPMDQLGDVRGRGETSYKCPSYVVGFYCEWWVDLSILGGPLAANCCSERLPAGT
jgi:hypothetical protein